MENQHETASNLLKRRFAYLVNGLALVLLDVFSGALWNDGIEASFDYNKYQPYVDMTPWAAFVFFGIADYLICRNSMPKKKIIILISLIFASLINIRICGYLITGN